MERDGVVLGCAGSQELAGQVKGILGRGSRSCDMQDIAMVDLGNEEWLGVAFAEHTWWSMVGHGMEM